MVSESNADTEFSVADSSEGVLAIQDRDKDIVKWAEESWGKTGGPKQYLLERYSTPEQRMEFAETLQQCFTCETTQYLDRGPLKNADASSGCAPGPMCLHPKSFNFDVSASTKTAPELNIALRLLEEILLDGFLTETEPLHICPLVVPEEGAAVQAQTIGYIKGQARMLTCLALLSYLTDEGVNVKGTMPKLWKTASNIFCYYRPQSSKTEEMFANFLLSTRGAIRKPPHTFQWVDALTRLGHSTEGHVATVIKDWNGRVARGAQLTGAKSMSVKNVMTMMPPDVRRELMFHISKLGWDHSCISEDTLQSKKIFPSHTFRCTSKEWTARGKVTPESMLLTTQYITGKFERMPKQMRRKPDRKHWEDVSQCACVLLALVEELKSDHPIADENIQKQVEAWVQGYNMDLDLELCEAVREKNPKFKYSDLRALRLLVEEHASTAAVSGNGCALSNAPTQGNLEENSLDLIERQIKYDVQAFKVWLVKTHHIEHHAFHIRLEAKQKAARLNRQVAARHCASCLHFFEMTSVDKLLREIGNIQKELEAKSVEKHSETKIATICTLNWIAPSTISSKGMAQHADIISILIHQSVQGVGLMLSPMFSYKKGGLWALEKHALNILQEKALVVDRSWSLIFSEQVDKRDSRPLQYKGRVLEPPTETSTPYWWKNSKLFLGYTDGATQLPAKDMQVSEEIGKDALPGSVDESMVTVQGAMKFQQIGVDAAQKVISALLSDATLPARIPILIVDLHAGVGNFAEAAVELQCTLNHPIVYVGVTEDPMTCEWLRENKLELVTQKIEKEQLVVAGHSPKPENVDNLIEKMPAKPNLNVLLFGAEDQHNVPEGLILPKRLQDEWISHPVFGPRFRQFLDKLHEEQPDVSLILDGQQTPEKKPTKPNAPPAQKRRRIAEAATAVAADHMIPKTESDGIPLLVVPLVGLASGKGSLNVYGKNKMQIVSESDTEPLVVRRGMMLAGFGRGKWNMKNDEFDGETMLQYEMTGSDDEVLIGQDLTTLLDIIIEKQKSKPDCRMAYFDIVPKGDGPTGSFTLVSTSDIVFVPVPASTKDATAGHLQTRVAAQIPIPIWRNMHYSKIVWTVKWGQNGLAPVRPQIVMHTNVTVKPGHCVLLN